MDCVDCKRAMRRIVKLLMHQNVTIPDMEKELYQCDHCKRIDAK
jgi:hypothetical protein